MPTELEQIQALLPAELFATSKDWREGTLEERVEWLLAMYASARREVARLEDLLVEVDVDLEAAEERYRAIT